MYPTVKGCTQQVNKVPSSQEMHPATSEISVQWSRDVPKKRIFGPTMSSSTHNNIIDPSFTIFNPSTLENSAHSEKNSASTRTHRQRTQPQVNNSTTENINLHHNRRTPSKNEAQ
jgi:hypothetical protein